VAFDPLYRPNDLLRFVDVLGGVPVPGSAAVVYVANTTDGQSASADTALWLADGQNCRRLGEAAGAQSRPAVSPDGSRVA
jgi:hypothetical protein